jgi:hypothetical protein
MKLGQHFSIIISVICVLGASWMHSGCIFVAIGYLIATAFYYPQLQKSKISLNSVIILAILILGSFYLISTTSTFTERFENIDIQNTINQGIYIPDYAGESAYLTWINPDNPVQLVLFSPLTMFYFIFSPIPLNWRGLQDIIAFALDSCFYFYFVYSSLKYRNQIQNNKSIFKYIFISILFSCFVFAYGTQTAGTAIRHRCKIFPLFVTMYILSISGKEKHITYYKKDDYKQAN